MQPATALLFAALVLGCSACTVTVPRPAYQKLDQEAPAFKEAVALEKKRQEETGRSPAKAEASAIRKVSRQIIQTESQRRAEQVTPLAEALRTFERPRGCWAYTLTTTTRTAGKTTVEVVRFDAFQPEERVWTLVSRDGQAPDEKAQASYRRGQLRAWKRAMDRAASRSARKNTLEAQMWNSVSMSEIDIAGPSFAPGQTTFTFASIPGHFPLIGDIPPMRSTYTTESTHNTLVHQTETFLKPWSILGGTVKFEIWDTSSEYALLEPDVPPFPMRTKIHQHVHVFGKDYGEMEIEIVYSDYRRVKCYDDRFQVRTGAPDMMDFVPSKN